jgi:hypothetical protein
MLVYSADVRHTRIHLSQIYSLHFQNQRRLKVSWVDDGRFIAVVIVCDGGSGSIYMQEHLPASLLTRQVRRGKSSTAFRLVVNVL